MVFKMGKVPRLPNFAQGPKFALKVWATMLKCIKIDIKGNCSLQDRTRVASMKGHHPYLNTKTHSIFWILKNSVFIDTKDLLNFPGQNNSGYT